MRDEILESFAQAKPAFLEYRHAGDRYSSSVTIETISSGRWTS
jgi:hypothetical protein